MSLRRTLLSQSALVFGVRIAGAGLVFVVQAMMARLWGPEVLGQYLVAIAAANLLAICLPLGFQTIGTLFAAEYAAKADGQSLRRFILSAYGHIIFPGLIILGLGGWLVPLLGEAGQRLAELWLPIALLAAGTAVIYINGAVLIGLKRPLAGFFADTIFRPLIVAASFGVLAAWGNAALEQMLWGMALSYALVALVHFGVTVRSVGQLPRASTTATNEVNRWWHFALPWVAISLASDFFFDLDLLFLTPLMSHEAIAVFGVCTRIFVLASFGVMAVYSISVPGLMEDEAKKDPHGLAGKIADANLAAAGLCAALLAGVAVVGPLVLSMFGPEFEAGLVPLLILTAGLAMRSIFGPASLILSARNHPYASLPAIGAGLAVLLAGNYLLVPQLGITGAALSALLALSVGAAGLWWTALRLTGVDVSIVPALQRLNRWRGTQN